MIRRSIRLGCTQYQAQNCSRQTADHIGKKGIHSNPDTGQLRCKLIQTCAPEIAACRGQFSNNKENDKDNEVDDDGHGDGAQAACTQEGESLGNTIGNRLTAIGEHVLHTLSQEHGAQCSYKGRNAQLRNAEAVDQTDGCSKTDTNQQANCKRHIPVGHFIKSSQGRNASNGANGHIHTTGEHCQSHTAADNSQKRSLNQDGSDIGSPQITGFQQKEEQHHNEVSNHGFEASAPGEF